ncbi:MAG: class I SAM-dependent methyltransferase [Sedimentisphaerales bacterium]
MTRQGHQSSKFNDILRSVDHYYSEKLSLYGATAKGVDWNSRESQKIRFKQLLQIFDFTQNFSIIDYGCGYGALADYLIDKGCSSFKYYGYDLSKQMISKAKELHKHLENCHFLSNQSQLKKSDYTVASGIFNVKQKIKNEVWADYVLHILSKISKISKKGFSFNMLTSYSDKNRMRPDLYYADPLFIFDYCKKRFSNFVSLLHDYPLYEFTILVKK